MVAYLARTHEDLVAEEVDVVHEVEHRVVGECERACRGELTFALLHEVHHGILDNLGVHLELRDVGVLAQAVEHGIGHVAHTRLQREELLGHLARAELLGQEVADVVADAL